jgi:CRISPR-associated protein Cmr4
MEGTVMKSVLFRMECLTDMHVGNGEVNYSIINNEVQKDTVLTDVPIIQASGVKGAIKEYFEGRWGSNDARLISIFGDEKSVGGYKFFNALCVARPLRVTNGIRPYVLTAATDVLQSFSTFLEGIGLGSYYQCDGLNVTTGFSSSVDGLEIEGITCKSLKNEQLEKLIDRDYAITNTLRDYDLPVRARNMLDENGMSRNLWYEEMVPHKSIFYFAVLATPDTQLYKAFKDSIEEGAVQFGGNASIGNGYTRIREVYTNE